MNVLAYLTSDALPWATIYCVLALVVLGLAWASREDIKLKLALVLGAAWVSENFLHDRLGRDSPVWIAVADLGLLACVGFVGYVARSWCAFLVAALFSIDQGVIWSVQWSHTPPTGTFYAALNVLYLGQLLVVGVGSGLVVVRRLGHLHGLPRRLVADRRQA